MNQLTDTERQLVNRQEMIQTIDALCSYVVRSLKKTRKRIKEGEQDHIMNLATERGDYILDYAHRLKTIIAAPPDSPRVERYADGVLVHWPEGMEQYVAVGDCVTGNLAPPAAVVPAAMRVVLDAMRSDPEYAWSWHCNIAMAFVDEGGDHALANHAAARFMRSLAGVDPAHKIPAKPAPVAKDSDNG